MVRCSVLGCKSDSERKIPDLSFHSFPDNDIIRRNWIEATGRTNWFPKKSSRICSRHFEQNVLVKKKKLTVLIPNAVPLLEINTSCVPTTSFSVSSHSNIEDNTSIPTTSTSTIMRLNENMEIDDDSTAQTNFPIEQSAAVEIMEGSLQRHSITVAEPQTLIEQSPMELMENRLLCHNVAEPKTAVSPQYTPRTMRKKLRRTQQQSAERLKKLRALREKSRRLMKKVANLEDVITELKAKSFVTEEDGELLKFIDPVNKDFLTKYLNPRGSGKKFSPALRKFALCLNFISPRAYKYVRQQFKTCLPHPSTLTTWYKSVDGSPGFTTESLDCIKLLAKRKDKKLYCALSMDEMSIRRHVHWDGENCIGLVNYGEALDGHNVAEAREALVFMLTSINDGWKIPVGYFLINGCSGEQKATLVTQCINLLLDCDIFISSLTFDGCPANFSMAKRLGCSLDSPENIKPFFVIKGHEIVIIPDPAHMLKLVRNTLGQKKELTNTKGELISWQFIEKLNELQDKEGLHLANRLRAQHVNFTKQIMKVKLAAQTFSNSVANAIQFCNQNLKLHDFLGSDATVEFIIIINNLFDILNSRTLQSYGFKKPICEKNGLEVMDYITQVEIYLTGLKFMGKSILDTNRRVGFLGLLICINSLKKMYNDYIITKKLKFLPFYKLSQDHLECFFSSIRSKGGFNNNPTAFQFQSAYKRLVVHGEIKSIESGNCIPLEEIKILTHTEVRYEAKIDINATHNMDVDSQNIDDLSRDIDNDHDYIADPSKLTMFAEEIIPYIGGFVVKKIKASLKCEDCLLALVSTRYPGLILSKDKGGLNYPSHEVIKICTLAEKVLKRHLHDGISFFSQKNILPRLIFSTLKGCQNVFTTEHFNSQPFIGNHRILLIKAIAARYLELRIHHATKMFEPKVKIRNVHNKLVLFKGQ